MRFGWHVAAWLALAVVIAVGSGVVLWQFLSPPDSAGRIELLKITLAVPAGIGAVVALVVASRKQHLSEAEHGRQEDAARREDTKLFNERFGRAADQLSADKPAARLAGVYAMAGLADDWQAGRQTCIDVLCAYLRMPYVAAAESEDGPPAGQAGYEERLVRNTIIRVITSRLRPGADVSWQGRNFDFKGAVFDGGSFDDAVFSGATNFDYAIFAGEEDRFINTEFSGGRVSFHGAKFPDGEAAFVGAKFTGAVVDFSFAEFSGGLTNFIAAKFLAGLVNFSMAKFTGGEVAFVGAEFSGAEVDFHGASFDGATVGFGHSLADGTRFSQGASFTAGTVDFDYAGFSGGKVDFVGADIRGGTVRLSTPGAYDAPPVFEENWHDDPPTGLHLPESPSAVNHGTSLDGT